MTKHTPSSPEGEAPRRIRISDYGGTFDRRPAVPARSSTDPVYEILSNLQGAVAEQNGSINALIGVVRLLERRIDRLQAEVDDLAGRSS